MTHKSKYSIIVPTDGDPARWKQLITSYYTNTKNPKNFSWIIIDNNNAWKNDFQIIKDSLLSIGSDVEVCKLDPRVGLMDCWNIGLTKSINKNRDWSFIINDDIVFEINWDQQWEAIKDNSNENIMLLCHPYNWSGFAVNKDWYNEWHWMFDDIDWPAAYYEDDFIYLEMAYYHRLKTKAEIYGNKGPICCVPYRYSIRLFEHKHIPPSRFANKWDKEANKKVFNQYWREVSPDWEKSIEAKDGKCYVRNFNNSRI